MDCIEEEAVRTYDATIVLTTTQIEY